MSSPHFGADNDRIAGELEVFLQHHRLKRVFIAEGAAPPPQLAFLVHFPRLSLTVKGNDEMEIELEKQPGVVSARAGEAVFVPPNCWNKPTWCRPGTVLHFLFGKTELGISLVAHQGTSQEPTRAQTVSTHRPMRGIIQSILNTLINLPPTYGPSPVARLLVEALLYACLHLLRETTTKQAERKARTTYDRICFFVQANFHKPLTRESIADHFRLNPNHLSRLFRQEGSMKFMDYLTWVRIDRAKYLLKHHHELPLDAVAAACGYNETAYFCRAFKAKTKLRPTEYRQA